MVYIGSFDLHLFLPQFFFCLTKPYKNKLPVKYNFENLNGKQITV